MVTGQIPEAARRKASSLPLGDPGITRERFGTKSATLSRLWQAGGIRIPRGVALDIDAVAADTDLHEALERIAADLLEDGRPLIARSSAIVEDGGHPQFPGRFASRRDLSSVEDLLEGVKYCVSHATDARVLDYRVAHGLDRSSPPMSVLIQEQVSAEFAGVVFTRAPRPFHDYSALIELGEGDGSRLLAGSVVGGLFGVNPGPPVDEYVQLAGNHYDLSELTPVVQDVFAECRRVEVALGESQDIEWVWAGGEVYIVQARPSLLLLPKTVSGPAKYPPQRRRPTRPLLEMTKQIGQKAAAERYFERLGCGAANGLVVSPKATEEELGSRLRNREVGPHGSVIRFSLREKAGLPVAFVPRDVDLVQAYFAARPPGDCAGIISNYVFADHAFEAFVARDHTIVEHVPGNWEPRSSLLPDVLLWEGIEVEFWRYKEVRKATYELPSRDEQPASIERDAQPLAADEVEEWVETLAERLERIRADFYDHLPLNVHFIRAGKDWHFLNIRPTRNLTVERSTRTPDRTFKPRRCFLIAKVDDLRGWDGMAPLLVTHEADSAGRGDLSQLAAAMRSAHVRTVLTTFGALSHPALVLREFGIEVHPMYRRHDLVIRRVWRPVRTR